MIRVLDETRSVAFYKAAFNLEIADRYVFDGFSLVYLRNSASEFEVELTVNGGRTEPYALGDGFGHLALVVEDLEEEHIRLQRLKLKPGEIRSLNYNDTLMARFFFIEDPDGYKIEVLQRHGRFR